MRKTAEETLDESLSYHHCDEMIRVDTRLHTATISAMREFSSQEVSFAAERALADKKDVAVKFTEWKEQEFWIFSSNNLWYKKSDGNPDDGLTTS